jgi:hypothetical protein
MTISKKQPISSPYGRLPLYVVHRLLKNSYGREAHNRRYNAFCRQQAGQHYIVKMAEMQCRLQDGAKHGQNAGVFEVIYAPYR